MCIKLAEMKFFHETAGSATVKKTQTFPGPERADLNQGSWNACQFVEKRFFQEPSGKAIKVFERSKLSRLDGLRSAQSFAAFLRRQHRPMSDLWCL
jgi:hypothetical protein